MSQVAIQEDRRSIDITDEQAGVTALHSDGSTVDEEHRVAGDNQSPLGPTAEKVQSATSSIGVGPPPNGGFLAWLQVAGAMMALFNSWGYVNTWAVFQDYFERELLKTTPPSTIAWIGSLQGFFIMVSSLFGGRLIDMGYGRPLLWIGSFMIVFGAMMTSLATEWYQIFCAQGLCIGIGGSLVFITCITCVIQYFTTKRATAIGITSSGSSLGGVLYPIMANRLIASVGFPWAIRAIGFVMLGTLLLPCIVMRHRIPPRISGDFIDTPSFRDKTFMFASLGLFFSASGMFAFIFYVNAYAEQIGVARSLQPYLIAILNAASIPGRILPNLIADRIGSFNSLIPAVAVAALLNFCWIATKSEGGMIALTLFYGFFSGAFVSLLPSIYASITPKLNRIGARSGLGLALSSVGFLICGPVTGKLISRGNGDYLDSQIFAGIMTTASVCFLIVGKMCKNPKFFAKA